MKKFLWFFAVPALMLVACTPETPAPDNNGNKEEEQPEVIEFEFSYSVDATGGTVSLKGAQTVQIPEDAASWISQTPGPSVSGLP